MILTYIIVSISIKKIKNSFISNELENTPLLTT